MELGEYPCCPELLDLKQEITSYADAMCELFGNYGWGEGVRLEKYLADHFLVRGINWFVPHAFSPKPFLDPDCPPHFYAGGNNPQYRHFGALMRYMNRVATIIGAGKHDVPVAVLYHGESEWMDSAAMPFEKPLRALYDAQIDAHVLPCDVFANPGFYNAKAGAPFCVCGQEYRALVIPAARYLTKAAAEGLSALAAVGLPLFFIDQLPTAVCGGAPLPKQLSSLAPITLRELPQRVRALGIALPQLLPQSERIRILHSKGDTDVYLIINEAAETYTGEVYLPTQGECFCYDAWENRCEPLIYAQSGGGVRITLTLEPLKSRIIVFGACGAPLNAAPNVEGKAIPLDNWACSLCKSAAYPAFGKPEEVVLPHQLVKTHPRFSGFVRYETTFEAPDRKRLTLKIEDAQEGVEAFINGISLGLKIAPPFYYELTAHIRQGENKLRVEVATTLERQCYPLLDPLHKLLTGKPTSQSGVTGRIWLIED